MVSEKRKHCIQALSSFESFRFLVWLACHLVWIAPLLACKKTVREGEGEKEGDAPSLTDANVSDSVSLPERTEKSPETTELWPIDPKGPKLVAISFDVPIYEKPNKSSEKMGKLRLGAVVMLLREKPETTLGCKEGFYGIQPKGYVCLDDGASLDVHHPIAMAANVRPNTDMPLPYTYAFVRATTPQYLRIPTKAEQEASEFQLNEKNLRFYNEKGRALNKASLGANDEELPFFPKKDVKTTQLKYGQWFGGGASGHPVDDDGFDPMPFWLTSKKRSIPNVSHFIVPKASVFADRLYRHTGVSLIGAVKGDSEAANREFGVATDLRLIPISKLKPDSGSRFHGVEIDDSMKLPFAFVRVECNKEKDESSCPKILQISGDELKPSKKNLPFRSIFPLSGKTKTLGGKRYRELADKSGWIKADWLGMVYEPDEKPGAYHRGEKWIDVSIDQQTLVLWEGKKPVYATLVSTGQDGLGDPKTSKSTVRGIFRIQTKMATDTMDSNEQSTSEKKEEEGKTIRRHSSSFELRDVPYVQYFEAGYALHGAYWHDVFGTPRSHGCVNLAPIDSLRIFKWTEPSLPKGWHAVRSSQAALGTVVSIHR